MKRQVVVLAILLGTIGCDQATKVMARASLPASKPLIYLGDLIRLQHTENTGAFLSLGAQLPESLRFLLLTLCTGVFLAVSVFFLFFKKSDWNTTVGIALLSGGGIGNLIDRLWSGSVTDFLNLGIGPVRTGIFNVADVAILLGVGFILIPSLQASRRAHGKHA